MLVKDAQSLVEDGMRHLAFSAHLCVQQARSGRYFALEHPVSAASWDTEVLAMVKALPGVEVVEFDFCALGMVSADEWGTAPVKKRTRVMTNCPALIRALRSAMHARPQARTSGAWEGVSMPMLPSTVLQACMSGHGEPAR